MFWTGHEAESYHRLVEAPKLRHYSIVSLRRVIGIPTCPAKNTFTLEERASEKHCA
jgi:hypothetical protein